MLTGDPTAENSLQRPTIVLPREEAIGQITADHVERLGAHSLTIVRVPAGGGTSQASPSR